MDSYQLHLVFLLLPLPTVMLRVSHRSACFLVSLEFLLVLRRHLHWRARLQTDGDTLDWHPTHSQREGDACLHLILTRLCRPRLMAANCSVVVRYVVTSNDATRMQKGRRGAVLHVLCPRMQSGLDYCFVFFSTAKPSKPRNPNVLFL